MGIDALRCYLLSQIIAHEKDEPPGKLKHRQTTSELVLTYRHNLDTAFSILPNLKSGLDVNVKFDHIHGFEPTAELAMFDLFNVRLVHGWIADPQDTETFDVIVNKCGTYNHTVERIVQADELNASNAEALTTNQEQKLHEGRVPFIVSIAYLYHINFFFIGFIATEFLKDTATQLTYYGLDLLLDSIPKDTLCVLFRNNHVKSLVNGYIYYIFYLHFLYSFLQCTGIHNQGCTC